jgi:hypothetical protein
MSYDIKIQNSCDHKILWARAQLEPDRKTVYLPYPLASVASFKVRINGEPQVGTSYTIKSFRQNLSLIVVTYIEFLKKIKHNDPIIEVNYAAISDVCPKCLNVKYIDDFSVNGNGDLITVNKELLLLQQVEKVIITKLSTNIFHTWYGTEIHSFVGMKITDRDLLYTRIREQVSNAIDKLKNVQRQMESSGRKFDPGELFGKLLKIDVEETEDPTILLVNVSFTSRSDTPIEYSQYLSLNSTKRQRMVL